MKIIQTAAVVAVLAGPGLSLCAGGSVSISAPADGAKVASSGVQVTYDVVPGDGSDHVHVYVDGDQVGLLHQLKGTYTLDKLSSGEHTVCVKVVDKGHTPTGAEKCVKVSVAGSSSTSY